MRRTESDGEGGGAGWGHAWPSRTHWIGFLPFSYSSPRSSSPGEVLGDVPGEAASAKELCGWYILQTKVLGLFLVYVQLFSFFFPFLILTDENSPYIWQLIFWKWQGTSFGTECAWGFLCVCAQCYLSKSVQGSPGRMSQRAWDSDSIRPQQREKRRSPRPRWHWDLQILLPRCLRSLSPSHCP